MKTTVITHFWNEEILLPYWLKHHLELFDHGILINYRSTDKSVEIIKELAPHWDLVDTINGDFNPCDCDHEISNYEKLHPGWKIALTGTEFLCVDNLHKFLEQFQKDFPTLERVRTQGVIMVDSPDEQEKTLTEDHLVLQRHHGYIEALHPNPINPHLFCSRSRLLHKKHSVEYTMGRHILMHYGQMEQINNKYNTPTERHLTGIHPDLFLCWFGKFSPFEAIKQRYLNTNTKRLYTPRCGISEVELVEQRRRSIDLLTLPKYKEVCDSMRNADP